MTNTQKQPVPSGRQYLLTIPEVARALAMSEAGVRRWVLERRIAVVKVGRLVRVRIEEIDRILAVGFRPRIERDGR